MDFVDSISRPEHSGSCPTLTTTVHMRCESTSTCTVIAGILCNITKMVVTVFNGLLIRCDCYMLQNPFQLVGPVSAILPGAMVVYRQICTIFAPNFPRNAVGGENYITVWRCFLSGNRHGASGFRLQASGFRDGLTGIGGLCANFKNQTVLSPQNLSLLSFRDSRKLIIRVFSDDSGGGALYDAITQTNK